jgi:hypothetical protein
VEEVIDLETDLDYTTVFGLWREAFGHRLEIRPYASELLCRGDAVDDFWHAVGLGSPPERRNWSSEENRRPGAIGTEMLRALRALLADHRLDGLLDLGETFSRAEWRVRTELLEDRPFARLTHELVARIPERYSASNEKFGREYLGGRHASLFSVPTPLEDPPAPWSPSTASERELTMFAGVVEETLNRVGAGCVDEARGEVGVEGLEEVCGGVDAGLGPPSAAWHAWWRHDGATRFY